MIEFFGGNSQSLQTFLYILAIHLPRALIFMFFFPVFGKPLGGSFLKVAICTALLLIPVSAEVNAYIPPKPVPIESLVTALGETVIGVFLGMTMAIPYFVFKAYGALVDVYRGATFAAQASGNTDTGSEELPLESLFGLVYAALIFAGPGLHAITNHLLKSYLILPPGSINVIAFKPWALSLIRLIGDHVVLAFLLAAPVLLIILMVEVAMQIVSAFTPQMQVYSIQFGFRSIAAIGALAIILHFSENEIMNMLKQQSTILTNLLGELTK